MSTATSPEPAITYLHYDELKDYAIRDLARIEPGMEVLSIHRPTLDVDDWMPELAFPAVSQETIAYVSELFWEHLHALPLTENSKRKTFILFERLKNDPVGFSYNFPTDVGVEPYFSADGKTGFFNDTNFLVDLDELYRAGVEPIVTDVSADYSKAVSSYNSTVAPRISSDPDYGSFI